jgi:fatty-acyl-CoA synthase
VTSPAHAAARPRFSDSRTSAAWILGDAALPAHVDPGRYALRWPGHDRTYAQLRDRALGLAAGLRADGLQVGDRVATLLYNRGETFELYFACAYAGLTLVPVNFRMTAAEVELVLRDCGARLLVTEPALAGVAAAATAGLPGVSVLALRESESGAAYERLASELGPIGAPAFTDTQLILYTSGTTGRPKGVMLSHTAIMWFAMQQAALYPQMTADMVMLLTGPTFNTAGINEQSIPAFFVGGTNVIHPSRGWKPERMAALIDDFQVTHTLVFPGMMEQFLDADTAAPIEMASLRFVLTGGENCPTATVRRFRKRWDHLSLAIGYGLTEAGVITWICDDDIDQHPGSVGRAFGGQTFLIVDGDGRPVPPGQIGEIITAAPVVATGYWSAPELTQAAIGDGWLRTGDLGRQDDSGYLYIEGRSKDMIISGGQNIYPAEIENVLSEHGGLLEWTVIGVPDRRWGEAVCAVVVARKDHPADADDVVAFVKSRLASYKKPKYVLFVDELPRNPSGKVLKTRLRAEAADLEDRMGGAS